jgi:hypothetical protein
MPPLREDPILEGVQRLPVDLLGRQPMKFHPADPLCTIEDQNRDAACARTGRATPNPSQVARGHPLAEFS